MGWDTCLTLDDTQIQSWRKHAPSQPSVLFRHDDVIARGRKQSTCHVVYRTTVAEATANLAATGFSWPLLLQQYADSRGGIGIIGSGVRGALRVLSRDSTHFKSLEQRMLSLQPQDEMDRLAHFLYNELAFPENTRRPTLTDLYADLQGTVVHKLLDEYEFRDINSPFDDMILASDQLELCRPIEHLAWLRSEVPHIGWFCTMVALLHGAPGESVVEFDLSGDARESVGAGYQRCAVDYATAYWEDATADLAHSATTHAKMFTQFANATTAYGSTLLRGRVQVLLEQAKDPRLSRNERGSRLEDVLASLVELSSPSLAVLEKRLKHADEEIDLLLQNRVADPFWAALASPLILVECKNWTARVGTKELRILESKMRDRGNLCKVGILVALRGISREVARRCRDLQAQGLTVFIIDGPDLTDILLKGMTLHGWLQEQGLKKIL